MICGALLALASPFVLRSGDAELEVAPKIGRVVSIRLRGGPNRLWVNSVTTFKEGEWANYGGDKLWTAPQSDWNWPPDPDHDGAPHRFMRSADEIELESPISRRSGIQFRRIVRPLGDRRFEFTNIAINRSSQARVVSVWQIAQIAVPKHVQLLQTMNFRKYGAAPLPSGASLNDADGPRFFWVRGADYKVGTSPPAAWRAVYEDGSLTMSARVAPTANYPDDGRAFQLYSSGGKAAYMELEVAGPLRRLEPGRSTSTTVILSLEP